MQNVRIQVLMPTYNHVNEVEKTLNSIWEQNYDRENIYVSVVDFGSTDGTVAKLFSYDNYHLGIYQKEEQRNVRLRVAEAANILNYVRLGGEFSFCVLLYPGEIMYPDCLSKCVEAFLKYYSANPTMVICEVDILQPDGTVIRQKPLYLKDRIIDGKRDFNDYIKGEYKHQVFEMVTFFHMKKYKSNGEINEQRFWNKASRSNHERNAIYLKEALVCTKAVYYEDEFEEILSRWEAIISIVRAYTNKFGHGFDTDFERLAKLNLAEYALWRSWLLYQNPERRKEMEDCLLIAGVISPQIEFHEIYGELRKLIFEKDCTVTDNIISYFAY